VSQKATWKDNKYKLCPTCKKQGWKPGPGAKLVIVANIVRIQNICRSKSDDSIYYVPRESDDYSIGGFQFDAVSAYQYTPKRYKNTPSDKPREKALLKIVIGAEEDQVFYFFGKIADNLLSQIEDKLSDGLNK
jgi:hypothetical protein